VHLSCGDGSNVICSLHSREADSLPIVKQPACRAADEKSRFLFAIASAETFHGPGLFYYIMTEETHTAMRACSHRSQLACLGAKSCVCPVADPAILRCRINDHPNTEADPDARANDYQRTSHLPDE
jgi:hypothetical protein